MAHEKSKWHTQTPTPWSAVPYACAQPYHPGSGSHGQLFRPCWDSSAWYSPRPGVTYDHRPSRLLPRRVHKHSFKRQLHTTHVVAVGWGQHGRPPTACVWGGGSAFLPIGLSVNLKWHTQTPTPRSAVPYECAQPYHPGSGSHGLSSLLIGNVENNENNRGQKYPL